MSARLVSLVVVVAALTSYHLAQRSMPGEVRPAPLFAFVYGAAALVMIAAVIVDGSGGLRAVSGTATHWAPWLLVLSVAGIELGVYAMYRTVGASAPPACRRRPSSLRSWSWSVCGSSENT